jgi:hypothetical protein
MGARVDIGAVAVAAAGIPVVGEVISGSEAAAASSA